MQRTETYFHSNQAPGQTQSDKLRLYVQDWCPESPKAHLILTHGLGEHSDCYEEFVHKLRDCQIRITAWDLRGHGRSQGARGAASHLQCLVDDLTLLLNSVLKIQDSQIPVILMGHSMGGLVVLKTVLEEQNLRRLPLILSSPFMGTALSIPEWKYKVSKLISDNIPEFTLYNEIRLQDLSRDAKRIEAYRMDSLRHDRISAGLFESALKTIETVFFKAHAYRGNILVIGSDNDPVVSTGNIKSFFDHLQGEKTLKLFEGRRHEVFNDLGKDEAFEALKEWLFAQLQIRAKRRPYLL